MVILIGGCASSGPKLPLTPGQYAQVSDAQVGGLPTPSVADTSVAARPYFVGPFDRLRVQVFGIEGMDLEIQADAGGQISFPLAGVIDAGGLTPRQIEETIEQRLREAHVRDPQVTVNLLETTSQLVTVDGQVGQPGQYPVIGRMTLVRAIASARGTTEFARQENVLVFRRVEGKHMVGLYNLKAIRQGLYPDPEIYPNDVVVVDEAHARRLFATFLQLVPVLTAPLIAVLQNNN